jgi:hypothetical protein
VPGRNFLNTCFAERVDDAAGAVKRLVAHLEGDGRHYLNPEKPAGATPGITGPGRPGWRGGLRTGQIQHK